MRCTRLESFTNHSCFRGCLPLVVIVFALAAQAAAQSPLPGKSTNMVSGTQWPGGDPFLQRQNEPSMAVSSRNPMHVVAGANDYRTVDLPFPQVGNAPVTGDAWLGFFTSNDGGATWTSTLVPGYPQDSSAQGSSCAAGVLYGSATGTGPTGSASSPICSPVHGLAAGADPLVRAAPSGMFVYTGVAFNRDQSGSSVFIARYTDDNNQEGGSNVRYLDTLIIAQGSTNANPALSTFLDKPTVAVDLNAAGTTCSIPAPAGSTSASEVIQSFSVYVAWTLFTGPESGNNAQIMLAQSHDCGVTWSTFATPISKHFVNTGDAYISPTTNQGAQIAVDPNHHTVLVVWRGFANTTTGDPNALYGLAFQYLANGTIRSDYPYYQPFLTQSINAFDQAEVDTDSGQGDDEFRTNDYPAIAIDGFSNVYVAWSQLGLAASGDSQIQLFSATSSSCAPCSPDPTIPYYATYSINSPQMPDPNGGRGNQIMPAIAISAGKVTIAWYDFRNDDMTAIYTSTGNAANQYTFVLQPDGSFSFGSQFGSPFGPNNISDPNGANLRHTVDIRAAQATATSSAFLNFNGSVLVSSYSVGTPAPDADDAADNKAANNHIIEQLQFNAPNLPLFDSGLEPFLGDYIDVAGPTFLIDPVTGHWRWNNQPGDPDYTHVVWTDNRDVIPPADGNWKNYTPVSLPGTSVYANDGSTSRPSCQAGQTGMRNQNIYTATLSPGLIIGAPGNAKPVGNGFPAQFGVTLQNTTTSTQYYNLTLPSAPTSGGSASFQQQCSASPTYPQTLMVTVPGNSTASRSVYVCGSGQSGYSTAIVTATQTDGNGNVLSGGLTGTILLNPDNGNPLIANTSASGAAGNPAVTSAEVYTPVILSTTVATPDILNPDILNPDILNPSISNVTVANPDILNPDILNPDILNPDILNPDILNPDILNPDILNPDILNPDILNTSIGDASYVVQNIGNSTAAYNVQLLLNQATPSTGVALQLTVSGIYKTPVANGCTLTQQSHYVPLLNDVSVQPVVQSGLNFSSPVNTNADTFVLAPGQTAMITIRAYVHNGTNYNVATAVTPVVSSQPANIGVNGQPGATPAISLTIATPTLASGIVGASYFQALNVFGGSGTGYTWNLAQTATGAGALPSGLSISTDQSGNVSISGNPTQPFNGTITLQVTDGANHTASKQLSLVIIEAQTVSLTPSAPSVAYGLTFTVTASGETTPVITLSGPCTQVSASNSVYVVRMTSGTGACTISGQWPASTVYKGNTAQVTVYATKAAVHVTFTVPASANVGTSFTPVYSNDGTITTVPVISVAAGSAAVCSMNPSSNLVTLLSGPGTCSLQAVWASDANYLGTTVTQSTSVITLPQTITFAAIPAQTAGTTLTLSATASSGLPVTFTLVPNGDCSLSGNVLKFLSAPLCGVVATQAGNGTYAAATPVGQTITVNSSLAQTITFNNPGPQTAGTPLTLIASATSGLALSFSSTGPCMVSSGVAMFGAPGQCSITATQNGNGTYAAATPVTQTFSVLAAPTIAFSIANQTFGAAPFAVAARSNSSGAFTYSLVSGNATVTASGTVTLNGAGNVSIQASQAASGSFAAAKQTALFTVLPARPVITWATPAAIAVGTPLSDAQLDAKASVAGTFSYNPGAGALLGTGTQTLAVTFTPSDATDYTSATASVPLTVQADAITLGVSSITQTYQVWNNFVIGPTFTGSRVPTGMVTLNLNGTALATLALGSNGKAYYTANPFNVGVNTLTASYSGDAYFAAGVSAPVTITVLPAPVNFHASCFGALVYGSAYQCTVNVSASTTVQPSGVITYSLDGAAATTVTLVNSSAAFTVPTVPTAGSHRLVINYAAQGNFAAGATINESFNTAQGQTELLLVPPGVLVAGGSSLTLSGMASTLTSGVPTGSVTIYDNGAAIGTADIVGNGAISYRVVSVARGVHSYYLSYSSSGNYAAARSWPVVVTAY